MYFTYLFSLLLLLFKYKHKLKLTDCCFEGTMVQKAVDLFHCVKQGTLKVILILIALTLTSESASEETHLRNTDKTKLKHLNPPGHDYTRT